MTRCSFEGCDNLYTPCTRMTFFNLPKDQARRDIWVANSGNRRLMVDYLKNKNLRRIFCEKHFGDKYKKHQFNRTTLKSEAVPDVYNAQLAEAFMQNGQMAIETLNNENDTQEEVPVAVVAPSSHKDAEQVVIENLIEIDGFEEPERGASASEHDNLEAEEATADLDTEAMQTVNKLIKSYRTKKPFQTTSQKQQLKEDSNSRHSPELDPEADIEETREEEGSIYVVQIPDWESSQDMLFECAEAIQKVAEEKPGSTENISNSSGQDEEDRCFVLSLLEPLKKLTPEQRAVAKVNILKYLLELEVGKKTATLS